MLIFVIRCYDFLGYVKSVETAVDYSNIDELADEESEKFLRIGLQSVAGPSGRADDGKFLHSNVLESLQPQLQLNLSQAVFYFLM